MKASGVSGGVNRWGSFCFPSVRCCTQPACCLASEGVAGGARSAVGEKPSRGAHLSTAAATRSSKDGGSVCCTSCNMAATAVIRLSGCAVRSSRIATSGIGSDHCLNPESGRPTAPAVDEMLWFPWRATNHCQKSSPLLMLSERFTSQVGGSWSTAELGRRVSTNAGPTEAGWGLILVVV